MKAKEFDKCFDEGVDISKYLDLSKARRPEQEQKRVNVDFPLWIKRQNVLACHVNPLSMVWVAERLGKASLKILYPQEACLILSAF